MVEVVLKSSDFMPFSSLFKLLNSFRSPLASLQVNPSSRHQCETVLLVHVLRVAANQSQKLDLIQGLVEEILACQAERLCPKLSGLVVVDDLHAHHPNAALESGIEREAYDSMGESHRFAAGRSRFPFRSPYFRLFVSRSRHCTARENAAEPKYSKTSTLASCDRHVKYPCMQCIGDDRNS